VILYQSPSAAEPREVRKNDSSNTLKDLVTSSGQAGPLDGGWVLRDNTVAQGWLRRPSEHRPVAAARRVVMAVFGLGGLIWTEGSWACAGVWYSLALIDRSGAAPREERIRPGTLKRVLRERDRASTRSDRALHGGPIRGLTGRPLQVLAL